MFISGGAEIYSQTLEMADRLYLTFVDTVSNADVFFPEFEPPEWKERVSFYHPVDELNPIPFTYKLLIRESILKESSLTN
ncbi:dihydrofolate reductase [Chloroflexota bacterium]